MKVQVFASIVALGRMVLIDFAAGIAIAGLLRTTIPVATLP